MKIFCFFALFVSFLHLSAENSSINDIVIISSEKDIQEIPMHEIDGIYIDSDLFVSDAKDELKDQLLPYLDQDLSEEIVQDIRDDIADVYKSKNHPIVFVDVPSQRFDGVLVLAIREGVLGKVTTRCNRWNSDERLRCYIRATPGEPINVKTLLKDLQWINRNPFRQADAIFIEAPERTDMVDIELVTRDRFPFRPYVGVDNTGIHQSGKTRWFAGFNWGDAFFVDHILSYQFTSGNNYNKFWAHSAQYIAPLPWRHTLMLFGGYSRVRGGLNFPGMRTKGHSGQASLRYEIPFFPAKSFLEEVSFGFDYKRTNSSLTVLGEQFFESSVNIFQIMGGYNCGYETSCFRVSGTVEIFWSPGDWLPDQENSKYDELRMGAKNYYVYGRAALNPRLTHNSGWVLDTQFRGQVSSENLLASEQFGLGGYNTVRGYDEREVNTDNMFLVNAELRTPPIPIFSYFTNKINDELVVLGFMDYGYGANHRKFLNEPDHFNLMGLGPGVRYVLNTYFTFRGDLGFKIWQPEGSTNSDRWMFYFGLVGSY